MDRSDVQFNLGTLVRAIESRDAGCQISMYAEDAEVRVVDPDHPPQAPMVLRGKPSIGSWIFDLCSLAMTHEVMDLVDGGDLVAFTEKGRYRDGTMVVSTSTLALRDGLIVRQRVVLVWDGWD
jgi:hypothetical protein